MGVTVFHAGTAFNQDDELVTKWAGPRAQCGRAC